MQIEFRQREESGESLPFLVWRLPTEALTISSAAVGGGLGRRDWVINAQVPIDYARTDLESHINELRDLADLPLANGVGMTNGVGMLTGAHVEGATHHEQHGVEVTSTVGVSEPEWAARAAPIRVAPLPGTINILAWIPVALSASALVNAVITATEAKTQAMIEGGLAGTGTATDAVCIACPTQGDAEPFAGPRSSWGHRLALAVHATVRDGVALARPGGAS